MHLSNISDIDKRGSFCRKKFIRTLKRDLISRISAIVICHPFHVIALRMMAQFVGKETKYR